MQTKLPALLMTAGLIVSGLAASGAAKAPSYHLIRKISLGGEGGWDYLLCDPAGRRVYISHSTHVAVINADSGRAVGDIPDTPGVHGIALDTKRGHGFTSNGGDNTVTEFDLKTLKALKRIPVGTGPDCIIFDPVSDRVFTFNGRSNDATAIDASSGTVAGTVALGGRPEFAAADGKGHVYDNLEDKSEVVEIDSKTLAVTHHWPLAPAESPSGLALDTKNRRVFSVCDGGKMTVLNADTGAVVATPAIGNGPDAAGFDPATGMAFSSNGQDGTLTIIHEDGPDTYSVVQTVTTQPGARTMALDTKTHRVFLVTATPAPAPPSAPGERRRRYVPGSFTVLVYGP